ncbi:hypothetical protein F9B85_11855 [Heliorestis acidaminivorans]|uniref:CotS family spore coat protein n=1 Tax=Heliorestis acidaminivorans TaxID=553427 RepID=A0A6I0EX41_9FIRM|nr:hypothetical protein [Heliorestis acidaminivorans]KAB2951713.1 hypothetical protein F9B85_11855 [Heliorestis acidaminivorans]
MVTLTSRYVGTDPRYRYPKKKRAARNLSTRRRKSEERISFPVPPQEKKSSNQGKEKIDKNREPQIVAPPRQKEEERLVEERKPLVQSVPEQLFEEKRASQESTSMPLRWEEMVKNISQQGLPWSQDQDSEVEVPAFQISNNEVAQILRELDQKPRFAEQEGSKWLVEGDVDSLVIRQLTGEEGKKKAHNIVSAISHLRKKGFVNCPELVSSKFGETVLAFPENSYYVYKKIFGKEMKLEKSRDYREVGRMLALFHRAGIGYVPIHREEEKGERLRNLVRDGVVTVDKWKEKIQKQRFFSDGDRLLKESLPRLMERANRSFQWIEEPYAQLYRAARARSSLCQGNFSTAQLIKTTQGIYIENFDHCRIDAPILDLAELVAQVARDTREGWKGAVAIIEGYEWVQRLTPEEWNVLLGYLLLPRSLWDYMEESFENRSDRIEVIPDRKVQDQGYKRARAAVEKCNRTFLAAYRLSVHGQIDLPS